MMMNMKKISLKTTAAAIALTFALTPMMSGANYTAEAATGKAGLVKTTDGSIKYRFSDGTYAKDQWIKTSNGGKLYIKEDGNLARGWENGYQYTLMDGTTGWAFNVPSSDFIYFNPQNGVLTVDKTIEIDGYKYTFDKKGRLDTTKLDAKLKITGNKVQNYRDVEKALIDWANQERAIHGKSPLKQSDAAQKAADIRAKEMYDTGIYSHTRPNGKSPGSLISVGKAKGENIGTNASKWNNNDSYLNYIDFKYSSEHYKNLLSSNFSEVGVAVYGNSEQTYCCFIFIGY